MCGSVSLSGLWWPLFRSETTMRQPTPSPESNFAHSVLNALRAAMNGEDTRLLTRKLLKLPDEPALERESTILHLPYIEELLRGFQQKETVIICLDESDSLIRDLYETQIQLLKAKARHAKRLLSVLCHRSEGHEQAARELAAFYVSHFRARESYIKGLLYYADTFQLPDMYQHWDSHLVGTRDLIEDSKELLVEVTAASEFSAYLIQRVYDSCVLIPASLQCQAHDMRHILSLNKEVFSFDDANLFSDDEKDEWMQLGLDAEQAGYWRAYDISPGEFSDWVSLGFFEARTAGAWKARGFDPEAAHLWAVQGFDASEAFLCRHGGITSPEEAERMRSELH